MWDNSSIVYGKVEVEEIRQVVNFFRKLDLEPSFKGLGLPFAKDLIKQVAEKSLLSDPMKNMPFMVKAEQVITAMEQVIDQTNLIYV